MVQTRQRREERSISKVNNKKKKPLDYTLLVVILILLTLGLMMVLSASAPYSLRTEGTSYYYLNRQLFFAVLGVFIMLVVSLVDYRIYKGYLAYVAIMRSGVVTCCRFNSWSWYNKKWCYKMARYW